MLKACGAGMAAMRGVDIIVFSGRFASVGRTLGPWLKKRLARSVRPTRSGIRVEWFREPVERVIADEAKDALLKSRNSHEAGAGQTHGSDLTTRDDA
jgi:hypothetical protein